MQAAVGSARRPVARGTRSRHLGRSVAGSRGSRGTRRSALRRGGDATRRGRLLRTRRRPSRGRRSGSSTARNGSPYPISSVHASTAAAADPHDSSGHPGCPDQRPTVSSGPRAEMYAAHAGAGRRRTSPPTRKSPSLVLSAPTRCSRRHRQDRRRSRRRHCPRRCTATGWLWCWSYSWLVVVVVVVVDPPPPLVGLCLISAPDGEITYQRPPFRFSAWP